MFPTFPTWLVLLVFGFPAFALGVVAGGITCLILRQHWSLRAAVIDGLLGSVVWVICAYMIIAIQMKLGTLQRGVATGVWLHYAIATASVVVRHLISRYFTLRISKVPRSTT
jgi:hypothetical protein